MLRTDHVLGTMLVATVARSDKADKVIITKKGLVFFFLVLALLWIEHSLIQAEQERHS